MKKISLLVVMLSLSLMLSSCVKNVEVDISRDAITGVDRDEVTGFDGLASLENLEIIEDFLDRISESDLRIIDKFYLYGSELGYEKVPTTSLGYLPFYSSEAQEIIDEIVPNDNTYIRPGKNRSKTKYIVIHNTGMASPVMTAKRLSSSINNSRRQASWHFTVDDRETYQQLHIDEIGWHAGSSEGNNYGIGIEMAVYSGIDFNQAMRRTAKLTASLMIDYNLDIDAVVKHYDFTGKNCPEVIIEAGRWEEFIELVELEVIAQTLLKDVSFNFVSLSPTLIDNEGRILKPLSKGQVIKYMVTVSSQGVSRNFEYSKVI